MTTARKPPRLEVSVEQYLVDQVEAHGGACEKFVTPGKRGSQDRLVSWPQSVSPVRPARCDFVEAKKVGGRISPWQKRNANRRREMGFIVVEVWSYDDVDEYIKRYAPKC